MWLDIGNRLSHVVSKMISDAEDPFNSFSTELYQYWSSSETVSGLKEDMDSSNRALAIMDSRTLTEISVIKFILSRAPLEEDFQLSDE